MKTETNHITVSSAVTPIIEVDHEAGAVYVRFKQGKVARTIVRPCTTMHIAVDLDAKGGLLGIEAVGMRQIVITQILKLAAVSAPKLNLADAQIIPTRLAAPATACA
ncbi:MAG TPA: DUF2283 domain-containing protein [Opitutaceae bacterium]|jgi:uncharacterized protein YuzE|nr:DUF2283 domain-containing protein [Opitutaceae bacterium]